jgi:hypothetical protein
MFGSVRQPVGRFEVIGFFSTVVTCDDTTQAWTAQVVPDNGRFAGGRATVDATALACSPVTCVDHSVEQPIRLRR